MGVTMGFIGEADEPIPEVEDVYPQRLKRRRSREARMLGTALHGSKSICARHVARQRVPEVLRTSTCDNIGGRCRRRCFE